MLDRLGITLQQLMIARIIVLLVFFPCMFTGHQTIGLVLAVASVGLWAADKVLRSKTEAEV